MRAHGLRLIEGVLEGRPDSLNEGASGRDELCLNEGAVFLIDCGRSRMMTNQIRLNVGALYGRPVLLE
jgi:uncharacterized phosphosugar-binding protein